VDGATGSKEMGKESVPFHENAVRVLNGVRLEGSLDEIRGALRMIIGTKIPKGHDSLVQAVVGCRVWLGTNDELVKEVLQHIENERLSSDEIRVGEDDLAHAG